MPDCPLARAARSSPDRLALHTPNETLTYRELDARVDSLRSSLPSTPLCTFDASPSVIPLLFAAWRNRQSVALLDPRLPPVAREALYQRLPHSSPPSDLLLFTSGSTGTPKLACLSLENLLASALFSIPITSTSRWLLRLPLHHVGGLGILFRTFLAHACLSLDEKDPLITHLSLVPTHLARATPRYRHLECLLLGGAPILSYPAHLPIFATYGLTEMSSLVTVQHHPPLENGLLFLGHPLPGRELKISPDGELYVRGKTLFQGYWEKGRLHLPVDEEGWFHTGDLARFCPVRGLAITGRKDWQFISGGENIQPEEIERHLCEEAGVVEAVVVAKSDPIFGAKPVAFLRVEEEVFHLPSLKRRLEEKLPKFKRPVEFHFRDEFPKVGNKTDRKKMI